ncbi:aquaporin family protein [Lactococcus lactis subsp. lactis]|uniref:MIP/aquaporin family protein n=1 Tax=Lactococcus lactis TaxID=1358 RepID=UPI0037483EA5
MLIQNCFGEFFGTFLMIMLGNGVVCANLLKKTKSTNSGWLTIIIGWGLAVSFAIYAVQFYSPAILNPAIALVFAVLGHISFFQAFLYSIFEILGAMFASIILWIYFYPHWQETKEASEILSCFSTIPSIRKSWSNFMSEFFSTALLVGMILTFSFYHFSALVSPLFTGGLIMVLGFSVGATTGFALNPARDFGPRLIHSWLPIANKGNSDWSYAWIPFLGPLLGALVGMGAYLTFTTFIFGS